MANEEMINYAIVAVLLIILYKIYKPEKFTITSTENFDNNAIIQGNYALPMSTVEVFSNVAEIAKKIMNGSSFNFAGNMINTGDINLINGSLTAMKTDSLGNNSQIVKVNNDVIQGNANVDIVGTNNGYLRLTNSYAVGSTPLRDITSLSNNPNVYNIKLDTNGNLSSSGNIQLITNSSVVTTKLSTNLVELHRRSMDPTDIRNTMSITPNNIQINRNDFITPFTQIDMANRTIRINRGDSASGTFVSTMTISTSQGNAVMRFNHYDPNSNMSPEKLVIDRNVIQMNNIGLNGQQIPGIVLLTDQSNTKIMVSQGGTPATGFVPTPSVILHESGLQVNQSGMTAASVILGNNKNLRIGRYTLQDTNSGLVIFKTDASGTQSQYLLAP